MPGSCGSLSIRPSVWPPLVVLVCALALCPGLVHAQSSAVEVAAIPAALEIPASGASVPLTIVLRNGTDETLRDIRLRFLTDAPVTIEPRTAVAPRLAARGDLAWTAEISAEEPLGVGDLHARVDYTTGEAAAAVSHVRTATLRVSRRASPVTDDVLGLKVESTLETLQQHRPGRVHLIVTNKSDARIEVSDLRATGPKFITLTPASRSLSLEPRETAIVAYDIEAQSRVVPGKHLLVFHGAVSWPGSAKGRSIVATRQVEVGVFGESAVLQALAVPSFLLLPGCLVLVTARLLWEARFLRSSAETAEFKFKFPNADFWLLSITISGLMAYAFPLFGQPSYLDEYGPGDVARVWMLSIFGLGLGGYVVLALARYGYNCWWMPSTRDAPLRVLAKLALHRCELPLGLWTAAVNGATIEAFPFGKVQDQPSVWVLPFIDVTFAPGIDGASREQVTQAVASRHPLRLWWVLRRADWRGEIRLKWSAQGSFEGPIPVKKESLAAFKRRDRIVRVSDDVSADELVGAAL